MWHRLAPTEELGLESAVQYVLGLASFLAVQGFAVILGSLEAVLRSQVHYRGAAILLWQSRELRG